MDMESQYAWLRQGFWLQIKQQEAVQERLAEEAQRQRQELQHATLATNKVSCAMAVQQHLLAVTHIAVRAPKIHACKTKR